LTCCGTDITSLDYLPNSLINLDCSYTKITSLVNLPNNLSNLRCFGNEILNLSNLPINLRELNCTISQIVKFNNLPNNLTEFNYCKSTITNFNDLRSISTYGYGYYNEVFGNKNFTQLPKSMIDLSSCYILKKNINYIESIYPFLEINIYFEYKYNDWNT
jgi:hypothetical protein